MIPSRKQQRETTHVTNAADSHMVHIHVDEGKARLALWTWEQMLEIATDLAYPEPIHRNNSPVVRAITPIGCCDGPMPYRSIGISGIKPTPRMWSEHTVRIRAV